MAGREKKTSTQEQQIMGKTPAKASRKNVQ